MSRTRSRGGLTGRGRVAVALALVLVLTGLYVGYRAVFGGTDCEVTVGDDVVEVKRDVAERAATASASGTPQPRSIAGATRRIEARTDLSGDDARLVATALTGRRAAALTCRGGGAEDAEADGLDDAGLTARAARVRTEIAARFGDVPLGGFERGGVDSGHMPGSAHYEGRAIDAFYRPINPANKRRGWAMAQYLVAHAERLEINTVIFDGQIWTARRSFQGWRDYEVTRGNRSAETIRILEHRDHVHVDVAD